MAEGGGGGNGGYSFFRLFHGILQRLQQNILQLHRYVYDYVIHIDTCILISREVTILIKKTLFDFSVILFCSAEKFLTCVEVKGKN